MSKRELIDRIRLFNPTAGSEFLRQFDERQLTRYLGKLVATTPPPRMVAPRSEADFEDAAPDPAQDPRQLALAF